jgi:hypothetical protein
MRERIVKVYNLVKSFFINKNTSTVKLETLLKAKSNLEQSIKTDWDFVGKLVNKKKPSEEAFTKAVNVLTKKEQQLVNFKIAQQRANLKTHLNGKSNFAYIYELSNLNNAKEYLESVKKTIAKLKLAKNEFLAPNRMLDEIVRKIQIITQKLSEFNSTQTVRVQLVPGMNLL